MIAIVDYGMGNLRSVEKALAHLGFQTQIIETKEQVLSAEKLILPGVGAFAQAMQRLNETGLAQAITQAARNGTPLMGICLGMQLMFEGSEENGYTQGLGLFPGVVKRLPDCGLKIPHMGWNTIATRPSLLFEGNATPFVYFVHSYAMLDTSQAWSCAICDYGVPFTAAISKDNVCATQFHPEKSSEVGLAMLKRFATFGGDEGC